MLSGYLVNRGVTDERRRSEVRFLGISLPVGRDALTAPASVDPFLADGCLRKLLRNATSPRARKVTGLKILITCLEPIDPFSLKVQGLLLVHKVLTLVLLQCTSRTAYLDSFHH